jgi:hypothetical protein
VRDIYQLAIDAIEGERKNYFSFFARYPTAILSRAVSVLEMFVGMMKTLRTVADRHGEKFESDSQRLCANVSKGASAQSKRSDGYILPMSRIRPVAPYLSPCL